MKRPYPTLLPGDVLHIARLIETHMTGAVAEHNEAIIELIKKMRDEDLYHVEIYDKIIKAIEPEVP